MSAKSKSLAKSLHTITALARVAEHIRDNVWQAGHSLDNAAAVQQALTLLGYANAADDYGLAAKAAAAMRG